MKANGYVVYDGPSTIDGSPIVMIVTNLRRASRNAKTGEMVQTYILCRDEHPNEATKNGQDQGICGSCPHRRDPETGKRSCYVRMDGPSSVWRAFQRGSYPTASPGQVAKLLEGRALRLGTYGDPAAVPYEVVEPLALAAKTRTGYTHRWAFGIDPRWRHLVMASLDGQDQPCPEGWRSFRVRAGWNGSHLQEGEVLCPASEEAGKKVTCATCGLCAGNSLKAKSVFIPVHGQGKKHFKELALAAV